MKTVLILLTVLFCSSIQESPKFISGKYDNELHLAFNPNNNIVTGYFNSATGYDESTDRPKFTCVFYLEGKLENNKVNIESYYPLKKEDDLILGAINLIDNSHLSIKLSEDHGGCWNVQPFSNAPINYELSEKHTWIEIRYISKEKANFYSDKNDSSMRKSYLIKGDIVYIDRIEDNWAYCNYYGVKTTTGWIKLESLNNL